MTTKQLKFCDEYLISGNATQAAIKAGYSPKSAREMGTENLTKPAIRAYLDERLEAMHNEKVADAREVMEILTAIARGQQTEQTLAFAGEGIQEIVDIDVPAKDRLKAAELIGKRYGMFRDNVSLDVEPVTIMNDLKE